MLNQTEKTKLRTWVELDRGAMRKNYQTFKKLIPKDCILMSVVKSNAYGHGLIHIAREMVRLGVNFLGTDSFDEALELRKAGIKTRILVFGYVSPAFFKEASEKNISITISSFPSLRALSKLRTKKKIKIHIETDTGLGRQGFLAGDMKKVITLLKKCHNVEVEGLYTHFAVGEDPKGYAYTKRQVDGFEKWVKAFNQAGFYPLRHVCASASTMLYPEFHYDMVRVGISLYGLWASKEAKHAMGRKIKLYPVLSWKAIITETKNLPKGSRIGYDLTEKLNRRSMLALVPVGYWHGYPRLLSSKGIFNVKGKKVKLMGRVSMDMMVVDVTDVPSVKVGDEVVIIGGKSGHYADADMMAQDADTINYEITTRINPIIKRFYRINPLLPRVVTRGK
jgi:alanine racemase